MNDKEIKTYLNDFEERVSDLEDKLVSDILYRLKTLEGSIKELKKIIVKESKVKE